ncbi:MAG: hypothetical protein GYB25_08925 [Rhodobacteraceae bacterium]|nr:hypothetical protein [Paracoccaceae bacterium]
MQVFKIILVTKPCFLRRIGIIAKIHADGNMVSVGVGFPGNARTGRKADTPCLSDKSAATRRVLPLASDDSEPGYGLTFPDHLPNSFDPDQTGLFFPRPLAKICVPSGGNRKKSRQNRDAKGEFVMGE